MSRLQKEHLAPWESTRTQSCGRHTRGPARLQAWARGGGKAAGAWPCERRAEVAASQPRLPSDTVLLALCESLRAQRADTQRWPLAAQSHPEARRLLSPLAVPAEGGRAGRHPGLPRFLASGPVASQGDGGPTGPLMTMCCSPLRGCRVSGHKAPTFSLGTWAGSLPPGGLSKEGGCRLQRPGCQLPFRGPEQMLIQEVLTGQRHWGLRLHIRETPVPQATRSEQDSGSYGNSSTLHRTKSEGTGGHSSAAHDGQRRAHPKRPRTGEQTSNRGPSAHRTTDRP